MTRSRAQSASQHRQPAPAQPSRVQRRRLVVVSVVGALLVAGGLSYVVISDGDGPAVAAGSRGALPPLESDPGVVHVHGLGVDPGDGTLYAATHSGLFRLPEQGAAVRVANRAQDTMGFSVVGPGQFIGSGHPDLREDDLRPPLLGLIASSDAGQTWDRLSLRGKADFHTLSAAHGQVYGYDSTSRTFMVSKDRSQWDRRAQLLMRDFAVSPTEPDTVLATTEQGLTRSTDGGRSFAPVAGAPALAVLAWTQPGALYGVAPDGSVQRSADGGTTWVTRGTVEKEPEAMTVDVRAGKEVLYVAARDRGILASSDGGGTFTTRYAE